LAFHSVLSSLNSQEEHANENEELLITRASDSSSSDEECGGTNSSGYIRRKSKHPRHDAHSTRIDIPDNEDVQNEEQVLGYCVSYDKTFN
jgi:hypothetical protein